MDGRVLPDVPQIRILFDFELTFCHCMFRNLLILPKISQPLCSVRSVCTTPYRVGIPGLRHCDSKHIVVIKRGS